MNSLSVFETVLEPVMGLPSILSCICKPSTSTTQVAKEENVRIKECKYMHTNI